MHIIAVNILIFLIAKNTLGKLISDHAQSQEMFFDDRFAIKSPHNIIKQLDKSITETTKNLTNNQEMDETLLQMSRKLVSSILTILEMQDKITRITKEALDATGKNKRITAIENRRILDYISKTLSKNILWATKESTELELHHLVYGLAQIATETSIVSALKDTTFAAILLKKQSVDLPLRKKRSVKKQSLDEEMGLSVLPKVTEKSVIYDVILNKTNDVKTKVISPLTADSVAVPDSAYALINSNQKTPIQVVNAKRTADINKKRFLNKTVLDMENSMLNDKNESSVILLDKKINNTNPPIHKSEVANANYESDIGVVDDLQYSVDAGAELDVNQEETVTDNKNEKKNKIKSDHLETKAKKAIMFAGDIAYLTASSIVAMRKALTASIEVKMSVMLAKNEMSNHHDLMMNLAKTAAQQVGKEAKIAASKSITCEKIMKLALKYTAQSNGAGLNHVATRIVLNTLPLSTLAKSMAFVSTDIAINSLYMVTEVNSKT